MGWTAFSIVVNSKANLDINLGSGIGRYFMPVGIITVFIGGKRREVDEVCIVNPKVEGEEFDFDDHPLDEIGEVGESFVSTRRRCYLMSL